MPAAAGQTQPATPAAAAPASAAPTVAAAPAPAAPALPTFAKPGELFMLAVTGATARCEAWTIDPEYHVLISKQDRHELAFEVTGKTLSFTRLTHYRGEDSYETGSCGMRFEARETDQAIVIDGAKLFRSAEGCAAALAKHERVALLLDCGIADAPAPARVQQATRAKLEALLASGGSLYSIVDGPSGDTCRSVRVRPAKTRERGWLEGSLEYDVVRDDGVKGTTALTYEMKRGATKITFLGPGTTWRDGGVQAFG
jgi:hypothetical protein